MNPVFRLKNPLVLMALAACYPVIGYAAGSARIDFAIGNVLAVAPSGTQRQLAKGGEVFSGETVKTGPDGRAQLRFNDGAMVSLQPQTDFRLDNYHFTGQQDGQEKGLFSLLRGGLRTITGLIGKANRDNYQVTTSVATIGIRGTEYTISYIDSDTISLATGEGSIEVCNSAGCAILSSGEAAVISGPDGTARITDTRPRLSPAQPGELALATFSTSENRNPNGSLAGIGLLTGSGYTLAFAGHNVTDSTLLTPATRSGVTAQFDAGSDLLSAVGGGSSFAAGVIDGGFSADGVIGWGRWSTGTATGVSGSSSLVDVKDLHYVVGRTTTVSDLAALAGITATYNLIGYTIPTATNGSVGGAPSGTLTASFGATLMSVAVSLSVPYAANTYTISGGTGPTALASTFAFNTACASVAGFFAGTNASHAGITYQLDTGVAGTTLSGAAAFKR
ncbi:MAG TPA: FecR family protein [Azonexus sp.]|nr:FecR family protein [Azonexus sp.]